MEDYAKQILTTNPGPVQEVLLKMELKSLSISEFGIEAYRVGVNFENNQPQYRLRLTNSVADMTHILSTPKMIGGAGGVGMGLDSLFPKKQFQVGSGIKPTIYPSALSFQEQKLLSGTGTCSTSAVMEYILKKGIHNSEKQE